ncbi:hypothetical protein ACLBWZ_02890 [Brucellaceae bacterium C25G]
METSVPGPDPGEGEQAKGNQTVLMVVFNVVAIGFIEIEDMQTLPVKSLAVFIKTEKVASTRITRVLLVRMRF